jgi:hypothetical protein
MTAAAMPSQADALPPTTKPTPFWNAITGISAARMSESITELWKILTINSLNPRDRNRALENSMAICPC